MILGDLIRQYRKETGMSMQEFADACGLSKAYISILERNVNPKSKKPPVPTLETMQAVGNVIGIGFNDLIAMLDRNQEVDLSGQIDSFYLAKHNPGTVSDAEVTLDRNLLDKLLLLTPAELAVVRSFVQSILDLRQQQGNPPEDT